MTVKEIIKAELKRLKNELIEEGENTMFEQGRISAFEDIDVFIDSLPEKPTWTNEDDYLRTETIQHLEELIRIEKQAENKPTLDIEIPFGAKDSELVEETITIPEGCYAAINVNKIIIRKGEKPIEWSKEDENMATAIMCSLDKDKLQRVWSVTTTNVKEWLKDLKTRISSK